MKKIDKYNIRNHVIDYFDRCLSNENLNATEIKTLTVARKDVDKIFDEWLD